VSHSGQDVTPHSRDWTLCQTNDLPEITELTFLNKFPHWVVIEGSRLDYNRRQGQCWPRDML